MKLQHLSGAAVAGNDRWWMIFVDLHGSGLPVVTAYAAGGSDMTRVAITASSLKNGDREWKPEEPK